VHFVLMRRFALALARNAPVVGAFSRSAPVVGALAWMVFPGPSAGDDAPFAIQSIAIAGRVVQSDLVDLDGDARGDLLCIRADGLPPDEHREIHVFYQRKDGTFSEEADWRAPLPTGVGAYDLAEFDGRPGSELILLRRDRITLLSFALREASHRDLPVGATPTIALAIDERGVDRLQLVREGLVAGAPGRRIPGTGWAAVLDAKGESRGVLDVGARANYYVPKRPGPLVSESEAQVYFDHPRLSVGDVDGDGRGDVVSTNRHELRVFLQDAEGLFARRPSRRIALGRISLEDHVRNSGAVRVDGADFDADGRLDLLISTSVGSLFAATSTVGIHLNRDGGWNLAKADQEFDIEGGLAGNVVIDLDGDGAVELIEARVPTGVLEVVETLVTRAIDAEVTVFRRGDGLLYDPKPWHAWKLGLGISFETFRTTGFVPNLEADFNGDGLHDLLGSGDGDRLEVHLGDADSGWRKRHATQPLDTGGRIRYGDLDGDGLADFVLYDSRRPGTPVLVGTNRGVLPGTVREPSLRSAE
jgi:hypothetical protein